MDNFLYTSMSVKETGIHITIVALLGGIVFAIPLLVEDNRNKPDSIIHISRVTNLPSALPDNNISLNDELAEPEVYKHIDSKRTSKQITPEAPKNIQSKESVPVSASSQENSSLSAGKIIEKMNEERTGAGLAPLTVDDRLNRAACAKAHHMITRDYWGHAAPDGTTPWEFFQQEGYESINSAENLAYGHKDNRSAMDGWMRSHGHARNILGDFEDTGLCIIKGTYQGSDNETLLVSLFGSE